MKLLLAEDERDLSKALVAILKHSSYTVDAVFDGQEALRYLQVGDYDAAILDIMMPKKDGISVLREARQAGMQIPILLLTAKSEVDDRVLGLDAGADDYLTKPFAAKELLARIRAMARRKDVSLVHALQYGNVTLDAATCEISTGQAAMRLTGKEYQLLEMMFSTPRQLISTERFMEKIWGYDSESEINVVWVCISGLRKKLASLGADVEIKATRGAGYTLERKT